LAVVSVGLDIGLGVAELESQKSRLEASLAELASAIAEYNQILTELGEENAGILSRINDLLASVEPHQSQGTWESWVESTRASLKALNNRLISVAGIMDRAKINAERTRGKPLDARVSSVAAVDPGISEEEARQIIEMVDRGAGKADPISNSDEAIKRVTALTWHVEGPGEAAIKSSTDFDQLTCHFGLPRDHGLAEATWTYYATAPWTKSLPLEWRYAAVHPPQRPFGKVSIFTDGPSGRQYTTLHDARPTTLASPAMGSSAIQTYKGQVFGIIIQATDFDPSRSDLQGLCGTYRREPVENNWHVGTIGIQDESGVGLKWSNLAGVSWDLVPDLKANVLRKTAGSPYQDGPKGGNEFIILRKNGQVSGFEFMGEVYAFDRASSSASLQPVKVGEDDSGSDITFGILIAQFHL
jgi:hypothetical protein